MANNTFRQKMEEYLQLYEEIRARTGDDRAAVIILQEVNKDLRMAQIREERGGSYDNGNSKGNGGEKDWPASPRQVQFLKKLDVEIPAGLTKKQASALIDEALAKESDEDSLRPEPDLPESHSVLIPWYRAHLDELAEDPW